jgi:DNA-binding transcriptional regulator YiaG
MSLEKRNAPRILPEYALDDLGNSFKVILVDSVECREGPKGREIYIPEYQALIKQIAIQRAMHPAKLKGADIRFLRKNLGMKSKDLAAKLDITPEHMSRCETGDKLLSPNSEKVLRTLVLLEAVYVLKKALEDAGKLAVKKKVTILEKIADLFDRTKEVVEDLTISPVHAAGEDVILRFRLVNQLEKVAANDDVHDVPREWLTSMAA